MFYHHKSRKITIFWKEKVEMSEFNNKIKNPIDRDPRGVSKVVDSDVLGQKAIPVVFVTKQEEGFTYDSVVDDTQELDNKIKTRIERDPKGNYEVVDSDVDGNKAVPLVVVTKNEDGKFEYASLGSGGSGSGSVSWDDVTNKPSEFPPEDHTHRSEEHTSELQSRENLVCRLLLEKKKRLYISSPI